MLCSISPIKRVYEVVLMLYSLRQKGYNAQLHIAGGTDEYPRYDAAIHRMVEKLGLQDSVVFHGYITTSPDWLRTIDIFISHSFWEGQQVALLEAMASGCYCLSHWWDGVEEVLPLDNLYVTDAELQEKLIHFYHLPSSEKWARQMELRTIACEQFDIRQTQSRLRAVVDGLVKAA
jgi:glycosyltransferase involved in cell wall biosynthesis